MDNSFRRQGSGTQAPRSFTARLKIFKGILNWLAGLVQLTEEEQDDAGIYFGGQR
ncbi:MAG: hypothetical protein Q7J80_10455 [Anaerolineales bacterium]|nr:hypothetical protein [Anaerolineales bacterium]